MGLEGRLNKPLHPNILLAPQNSIKLLPFFRILILYILELMSIFLQKCDNLFYERKSLKIKNDI